MVVQWHVSPFHCVFSSAGRGNGCGAGRHWIYDHGSCPHDWHACDTLCRSGIWAACSKIGALRFGLHALTNIHSSRGFNHGLPVGTIYLLVVYHKYGLNHHLKWENWLQMAIFNSYVCFPEGKNDLNTMVWLRYLKENHPLASSIVAPVILLTALARFLRHHCCTRKSVDMHSNMPGVCALGKKRMAGLSIDATSMFRLWLEATLTRNSFSNSLEPDAVWRFASLPGEIFVPYAQLSDAKIQWMGQRPTAQC